MNALDYDALRPGFAIRPDMPNKLRAAPYPTDRNPAGLLHAKMRRSPVPHARILRVDIGPALAMPGVACVITAADIPGRNIHGARVRWDQPMLCTDRVRHIGDPIAAVAADTPENAARAAAAIIVELEALPALTDAARALDPDAPVLHPSGNLLHSRDYARGDIGAAWRGAVHRIDAVYDTGRQAHAFMETEGGIVEPDGEGGLIVQAGTHDAFGDRADLALILGLDPARIRVLGGITGGSFGGKDGLSVQPIACLLALRIGRPVRLHYTRAESMAVGVKRHAAHMRVRTACDADGKLLAHDLDLLMDAGAYATHSSEVLDTAIENATGPYAFGAVRLTGRTVYTNNGIAGSFRGFGATQTQFALERQIDRLAALAGLDPAEMRARNLRPPGAPGPLGQIVTQPCHPSVALRAAREHPSWTQRQASQPGGRDQRGTGLTLVSKGEGFSKGAPNGGTLGLRLAADGMIEVEAGGAELGQGAMAVAVNLAVRALGCDPAEVRAIVGDTARRADTGSVAASRHTGMVYRGMQLAAGPWTKLVLDQAASRLDRPVEALRLGPGGVWAGGNAAALRYTELAAPDGPAVVVNIPSTDTPSDVRGHGDFSACAAVATVSVDTWTGRVVTERILIVPTCGPVIANLPFVGQIEGGAVMGLGLALLEDLPMQNAAYAHLNFDGYMIPSLADAPFVEVLAIDQLDEGDRIGPRGVGEIVLNAAVAAIANAVADATGAPITRIPIRPDDLL
jgi:CO/xanthine dehydrogenase Mo-binding subunit